MNEAGLQKRRDNDALRTKMVRGFKNEETERRRVHDELTKMNAASTHIRQTASFGTEF